MKTGIFYWFSYTVPIEERFRLIASAGFDNVILWWGDQFADIEGAKERLPDIARRAGLFVENIHTDFAHCNSIWKDNQEGESVFERYMENAGACEMQNIPAMVVHLTSGNEPPPANELGIDRLKRITAKAEKGGVIIALENLRKNEYLETVFAGINSPNLKLCYDSGHENCFTKKNDVLDRFGEKLFCVHLHDNDGTDDQHGIPGIGTIDWPALIGKLKQCSFKGSVTLEAYNDFPPEFKSYTAEKFLSEAYRAARKIADQLDGRAGQ
ncbi:MAG: sugar phosphate isomerase/epimerase [Treponema sp.]|nr:sugar phosphate isomerase/epimerase [Treponema sp.]